MHVGDGTEAYAGIFAQSPGITRAWSLPLPGGAGSETLLVQRTARNIEGVNRGVVGTSVVRDVCAAVLWPTAARGVCATPMTLIPAHSYIHQ